MEAGGDLDRLARSAARLAQRSMILSLLDDGTVPELSCLRIGPPLLFERLWRESGCRSVVETLAGGRKFEFAVERAAFLTVLHRLMVSGSDRSCEVWRADYRIDGVAELGLHHLYRAMAWLGEALPAGLFEGSPAGSQADDRRRGHRPGRPAGWFGNVAGRYRRRDDVDPGDRPAAQAFWHWPGVAWSPTAA